VPGVRQSVFPAHVLNHDHSPIKRDELVTGFSFLHPYDAIVIAKRNIIFFIFQSIII